MKSKTKIERQLRKKRNQSLVETIIAAKKQKGWMEVAEVLARTTKKRPAINLDVIDKSSKEGETVGVPGKVLSLGEITKKVKIVALAASESALEKIKKAKCDFELLNKEIKSNPSAKGIKILKLK